MNQKEKPAYHTKRGTSMHVDRNCSWLPESGVNETTVFLGMQRVKSSARFDWCSKCSSRFEIED